MSINLLPKIKVEIVVSEISVDTVIAAAEQALRTGHIGDGKIFVSSVDNAVRIRTGETGPDAIRDRSEEKDIVNAIIKE